MHLTFWFGFYRIIPVNYLNNIYYQHRLDRLKLQVKFYQIKQNKNHNSDIMKGVQIVSSMVHASFCKWTQLTVSISFRKIRIHLDIVHFWNLKSVDAIHRTVYANTKLLPLYYPFPLR